MKNCKSIEDTILKYSNRGITALIEHMNETFCLDAVKSLLKKEAGTVFIFTGFYVNGISETDGPVGAYFLARALLKTGYKPVIITDEYARCFFDYGNAEFETLYFPINIINAKSYMDAVMKQYHPIAFISIERCGKSLDNRYYNMRKVDITNHTAPLDDFFEYYGDKILTIGIGDGGNEIGMGNLFDVIEKELDIYPCKIQVDYLITSSVSNWGAYGFIAYLSLETDRVLLPTYDDILKYIEYIVKLGAVDGVTGKSSLSVDGFGLETEKEIIRLLNNTI